MLRVRILTPVQVHHILAEIVQGGLVLETNVEEIDQAGESHNPLTAHNVLWRLSVQASAQARKTSFASANPLALGVGGGVGTRSANLQGLQTPLGWLTTKFTGVGAR